MQRQKLMAQLKCALLGKVMNNTIEINNLRDFSIKQILDCGQVFRYQLIDQNTAIVVANNKLAYIKESEKSCQIFSNDKEYFENYFDLKTDYQKIKNELKKDEFLRPCCECCYGIRILRQDFFEMLVSFIISANNNIERIKKSVNYLSKNFGQKCVASFSNVQDFEGDLCKIKNSKIEYYAFPTLEELQRATIEDLKNAGLGYRAEQLHFTIQNLQEKDIKNFKAKSNEEKYNWLMTLKGVGEKVANCIMLFSESDMSAFPVDTWINKVYNDITNTQNNNRKEIEKNLKNRYKNYSGYAQQYFFYYYRKFKNK